jgi:hypothetical protein
MYTAKADGKGNYALFIPNRHVPATAVVRDGPADGVGLPN